MMKVSCCLCVFLVAAAGQTQKAHVHGAASVNIALEGQQGELEFEAPAEGVVGFERAPKNPAEKKVVEAALAKFRNEGAKLFQLPAAAACSMTPKEVEFHQEGQHAEVHAHYTFRCQSAPRGSLSVNLFAAFPKLREINVTLVSDAAQKSGKVTPAKPSFPL
jgi:hypothetical protein